MLPTTPQSTPGASGARTRLSGDPVQRVQFTAAQVKSRSTDRQAQLCVPHHVTDSTVQARQKTQAAEANLRSALERLKSFNSTPKDQQAQRLDRLDEAFSRIKLAHKQAHLARVHREDSELPADLATALVATLNTLGTLLAPARGASVGSGLLDGLDRQRLVVWCRGLSGAILGRSGCVLLADAQLKDCKASIRKLVEALARRSHALDQAGPGATAGEDLATLALLVHGMKRSLPGQKGERDSLLQISPTLRQVTADKLHKMRQWSDGTAPAHDGTRTLDTVAVGKALAQINGVIKSNLVQLDAIAEGERSWRQVLPEIVLNLLQGGQAQDGFTQWQLDESSQPLELDPAAPLNGVTVANVGNLLKDFLEENLFSAAQPAVARVLAAQCRWIALLPPSELLKDGAQVLSNCANFLRQLGKPAQPGSDAQLGDAAVWGQACQHLLNVLAAHGAQTRFSSIAFANLHSFVIGMAKLEARDTALPKPDQAVLCACVSALHSGLGRFEVRNADALSLSAVCSALSYFVRRNLYGNALQRDHSTAWIDQRFRELDEAALGSTAWLPLSREQTMRTALEMWALCDFSFLAARKLLPAWTATQDRRPYQRAALRMLREVPQLQESLQASLDRLLPGAQGKVGPAELEHALRETMEEDAPRSLPDAAPDQVPSHARTTTTNVGLAGTALTTTSTSTSASTATSTATSTTSTTSTTTTTTTTGASREPRLRAIAPPRAALRAVEALAESSESLSSDASDDDEPGPTTTWNGAMPPARASRPRRAHASNAGFEVEFDAEAARAQLVEALATGGPTAFMQMHNYRGRVEPGLYWAVKFGDAALVAALLSRLRESEDASQACVIGVIQSILRDGEADPLQQRAFRRLLQLAVQGHIVPEDVLEKKLIGAFRQAPLHLQIQAVETGLLASLDNLHKRYGTELPGQAALLRQLRMGGTENLKKLNELRARNKLPALALMVEAGSGDTALMCAVAGGKDMVRFCLETGKVPEQLEARNASGMTALSLALENHAHEALQVMLEFAGKVPEKTKSLLQFGGAGFGNLLCDAVTEKEQPGGAKASLACLRMLLGEAEKLGLVNELLLTPNGRGWIPFNCALEHHNLDAIECLLAAGARQAQLEYVTDIGATVLQISLEAGSHGTVEAVLKHVQMMGLEKFQLRQTDFLGRNLLMSAAVRADGHTVQLVTRAFDSHGMLKDALLQQSVFKSSPLMEAYGNLNLAAVDALLLAGCVKEQFEIQNREGLSALQLGRQSALVRAAGSASVVKAFDFDQSHSDKAIVPVLASPGGIRTVPGQDAFDVLLGKLVRVHHDAIVLGHPEALLELGVSRINAHLGGMDIVRDAAFGIQCLEAAARAGNYPAILMLGQIHMLERDGAPPKLNLARQYFQFGADQGDPTAQVWLAACLNQMAGVAMLPEAARYLEMAAAGNHEPACIALGNAYAAGTWTCADPELPRSYLLAAATAGKLEAAAKDFLLREANAGVQQSRQLLALHFRKVLEQSVAGKLQ